jgi:hypothetical protein
LAKVSLYSADYQDRNTVIAPGRANSRQVENISDDFVYDNLLGPKIVPSIVYIHPETQKKQVLFVFQQLSVRVQGTYRLCCQVFDISNTAMTVESIFTDVFEVYAPRDYPGQDATTALEKSLSRQGFKLYSKHSRGSIDLTTR